ncbi:MAG: hypothetical protein U9O53_02495 [archaeon]|nr:hypothetical protein [archaeon]
MNDTDAKLLYKRMAELNINIVNLGKEMSGLKKSQENLAKKLDSFPKDFFTQASNTSSDRPLDEINPVLSEITMTTDDIQKTVDNIFEAFTKDKVLK